jgi:hypothetical protein
MQLLEDQLKRAKIGLVCLSILPALLAACIAPQPESSPTVEPSPDIEATLLSIVPTVIAEFATPTPKLSRTPSPPTATSDEPSRTPFPTLTPEAGPPRCADSIEQREIYDPYASPTADPRLTMPRIEFVAYLSLMGITEMCIPREFGLPFLGADWNDLDEPPNAIGRRVRIEFDRLFRTFGEGDVYIIYATYDFEGGTEYEIFAREEDLELVRSQSSPNPIEVDGVPGFIRIYEGSPMGGAHFYRTTILPFDTYWVGVILHLGIYDIEDAEIVMGQLVDGSHPALLHPHVALTNQMVASIQFRDAPP